jgi:hypothetical protein
LEAHEAIDRKTAEIFLGLLKENKVPSWVLSEVDIDQIKLAAN